MRRVSSLVQDGVHGGPEAVVGVVGVAGVAAVATVGGAVERVEPLMPAKERTMVRMGEFGKAVVVPGEPNTEAVAVAIFNCWGELPKLPNKNERLFFSGVVVSLVTLSCCC